MPELIATLTAIVLCALVAIPTSARFSEARQIRSLQTDARQLFLALSRYQSDHGQPPRAGAGSDDGLNLRTLAPLSTNGYLETAPQILARLADGKVQAYDAPGLPGREGFWMILADASHPEIKLLVAATDRFPLVPDSWIEGIYLIRGNSLQKLEGAVSGTESGGGRHG